MFKLRADFIVIVCIFVSENIMCKNKLASTFTYFILVQHNILHVTYLLPWPLRKPVKARNPLILN